MHLRRHSLALAALGTGCLLGMCSPVLLAQAGSQGTIVLSVSDSSGAVIPDATLELVNQATNDQRTGLTGARGNYTFVNLPIGTYRLRIARDGFAAKAYTDIVVQASQTTSIVAALPVGEVSNTVEVSSSTTPVLETSSNEIGLVVDMKQIEDLPLQNRDLTQFSQLVAGYNGTFNGLPSNDQGSNIDGVIGNSSRMKFTGNVQPAVSPRIEGIAEMTVQTDQLNLNAGFGQSSTQVNFVSRSGTNRFHGRAYEDFQNSGLNANSWTNDVAGLRKNKLIINDFGVSLGGPVIHDKLFFFGSYAMLKQPSSFTASNNVFTAAAQAGNFTYAGGSVNLLAIAQKSGLGIPSTVNAQIAAQFQAINTALSSGAQTPTTNANYNLLQWVNDSPTTNYYPSARVDWNATRKVRMYLSWLMTKDTQPSVSNGTFPGSGFSSQVAGQASKSFSASYGLDLTIRPTIVNQFKAGYLYDNTQYAYNAAPLYATEPTVFWQFPNANPNMSGQVYNLPISTFYPILNASDSVSWQLGLHTLSFGGSWYREQDHYYNPPAGIPGISLGLATGDPALQAFTNGSNGTIPNATSEELVQAQQLYAILTGRISGVNGQYPYDISTKQYLHSIGEYPLDEVSSAFGVFFQDSWKLTPTLTLNYGLRWDFTGAQHDVTGAYHSASPSAIYGPSGLGNLFNPGSLEGDENPAITVQTNPYDPWKVAPQPAFGFAWNPHGEGTNLSKLLGGDATVIRGGFALRNFTEPYQFFADNATFYLNPNNTGQAGTFAPGSLSLGQTLPAVGLSPTTYQTTAAESQFTFQNSTGVSGIDPHIRQPYSESWNLGIQRSFGKSRVLEVRYNGNRTVHQWINVDPNEVNVFENGFLAEFKKAQANLAASAGGNTSFSPTLGQNLPIMTAAFGGPSAADFTNAQFIRYLQTGQVGALASVLSGVAGNAPYFCNLVGSSFSPCVNNAGYTGAGAGYPINFFQANPFAAGTNPAGQVGATNYLVARGYSNYNALQIDLRQGAWRGMQYDVNYTLSHSLGVSTNNQYSAGFNEFTLRNLAKSYGPSLFDLRNVLHANGTYDLPFGHGQALLNNSKLLDELIGHFNLGTIVTYQSGAPAQLLGQFQTFNDYADGGATLSGISAAKVQQSIGVHRLPGQTNADLIDPKLLSPTGGANATYLAPNTTPGTIGNVIYIHGPNAFTQNIAVSKEIPLRNEINLRIQGEFLNVWNHPVFGNTSGSFDAGLQDSSFGQGTVTNSARQIELRGNINF
jgi:hypothetical protein